MWMCTYNIDNWCVITWLNQPYFPIAERSSFTDKIQNLPSEHQEVDDQAYE